MTGVWSRGAKVAAIGVKLSQNITSHGFALNLTTDLDIFNQGIVPCGLIGKRATSVLELGGPRIEVAEAAHAYVEHCGELFGAAMALGDAPRLRALPWAGPERNVPRAVLKLHHN